MREALEFIFSGFWTYFGTVFLIYSVGHSLSIPFVVLNNLKKTRGAKRSWDYNSN